MMGLTTVHTPHRSSAEGFFVLGKKRPAQECGRPNNRVNPPGRTVTGLAKGARPAPSQPAGDAERWAAKGLMRRRARIGPRKGPSRVFGRA